jgi:transposase
MIILGIDISKAKVDVALLKEGKAYSKQFANTLQGFNQLDLWVKKHEAYKILACMEATGFYGLTLAEYLYSHNYDVSIVNPSCIKSYAKSQLTRHKTDKIDAILIAEYASKQTLPCISIRVQYVKLIY